MFALDNFAETLDGVLNFDVTPGFACELFGDEEGLGQELLNLSGPRNDQLVVLREFVDTQNGDDVLKVFLLLQNLLHRPRHVVVFRSHDSRIENTRR